MRKRVRLTKMSVRGRSWFKERIILFPDDRKQTLGHVFNSISPGRKLIPKKEQVIFYSKNYLINGYECDQF